MRKLLLVGLVIFGLVALGGCGGGGGIFSETSFRELEGSRTLRSGSGQIVSVVSNARYALTFIEGFLNITVKTVATDNTQATCDVLSSIKWEAQDTDGTILTFYSEYSGTNTIVRRTGDDTFSYTWANTDANRVEYAGRVELYGGGGSVSERSTVPVAPLGKCTYDVTYSTSK